MLLPQRQRNAARAQERPPTHSASPCRRGRMLHPICRCCDGCGCCHSQPKPPDSPNDPASRTHGPQRRQSSRRCAHGDGRTTNAQPPPLKLQPASCVLHPRTQQCPQLPACRLRAASSTAAASRCRRCLLRPGLQALEGRHGHAHGGAHGGAHVHGLPVHALGAGGLVGVDRVLRGSSSTGWDSGSACNSF